MRMGANFEELDYRETRLGELILRRRRVVSLGNQEVYEVILGEAFLMSSLFTTVEIALADLGLAVFQDAEDLDVVIGGLGLGFTAAAALKHPSVKSLLVIDALAEVIEWHERGMVPLGATLCSDPRFRPLHGDFFALASDPKGGFDPEEPGRRFHAVLLDIDHSPNKWLDPSHASFYDSDGLVGLSDHLHADGVFALWSDDPPDTAFLDSLQRVFVRAEAHVVPFYNPLLERGSASTVYVAVKAG